MNLMQMKPKESKLKLRALKKELTLRPINLADEAWIGETYGADEIMAIFEEVNLKEISRIVFRLIKDEDKLIFKSKIVTFITEDGEEIEQELGGVELLRNMVSGWEEKMGLVNALMENIGASRPEPREKSVKKKVITKTKKKKK